MKSILLTLASLLLAATAHAQWKTTTYTLKGGWNAIYLHGDASYATPETLFASYPEVQEVWRWNPNPTQVGFTQSPLIPSAGTPEWSVWKRGSPAESSLSQLIGQTAYLVKCSGTSSNTYSVPLKQSPQLPATHWVRNGANLLGFPTLKNGSTYPTMASYFATFPAAIAANTKIYKYVGGDLGSTNPLQVFNPSTERLDSTQAYWFSAEVTGDFYAPLEISPSSNGGLAFGRDGAFIKVLVRNRSAAAVTLTLTPVDSEPAPSSKTAIVGKVPLTKRSFNATSLVWTETPVTAAYTEVIGPKTTVELQFGINRGDAMMSGAASDAFFASLLRITDSGNLMAVDVPVTAQVSSLAGLWMGDVSLTNVSNKVSNGAQATATLTDGVITGLTVVGSGGFGYSGSPAVTIAPPHANSNVTATATATVAGGLVSAVTPGAVGSGYLSTPMVSLSAPTPPGVTATAAAAVSNGSVSAITLVEPGFNYSVAPVVALAAPPDSVNGAGTATVLDGSLTSIAVTTAGSYYPAEPVVTVAAPPAGITATATATYTAVNTFTIAKVLSGTRYTTVPTVSFAGGGGSGATAVVTLGLTAQSFKITSGDIFYATAPTVTISGGGSPTTTATATALLSGGSSGTVIGITITNMGVGYTTAPSLVFTGETVDAGAVPPTAVGNATQFAVSTITKGGTNVGYTSAPTVTISAPAAAVTATATATVAGGAITVINVATAGTGYTAAPVITVAAPPTPVQATANCSLNGSGVGTVFDLTNAGRGYSTAPMVTIATAPAKANAQAAAILTNGTITGYRVTAAGSGYTTAPTVIIGGPPANAQATATATVVNGSVTGFTVNSGGSGYEKSPAVMIDLPPPRAGTATATPFKLRTLLHLSDGGTARLLSEVYLGQLALAPNDVGLCTSEALLKQGALGSAQCFSSSHLPMDQVITAGSGSFATGQTLTRVITVPYNDATNPFVHAYHPDHDNKDARGNWLSATEDASGLKQTEESHDIRRTCQFIFTASPPAGSSVTSGWGSSVIGGNYIETMTGVHKDPLILSGTFELRRASPIGTLSQ
jgi:hypothetical protein